MFAQLIDSMCFWCNSFEWRHEAATLIWTFNACLRQRKTKITWFWISCKICVYVWSSVVCSPFHCNSDRNKLKFCMCVVHTWTTDGHDQDDDDDDDGDNGTTANGTTANDSQLFVACRHSRSSHARNKCTWAQKKCARRGYGRNIGCVQRDKTRERYARNKTKLTCNTQVHASLSMQMRILFDMRSPQKEMQKNAHLTLSHSLSTSQPNRSELKIKNSDDEDQGFKLPVSWNHSILENNKKKTLLLSSFCCCWCVKQLLPLKSRTRLIRNLLVWLPYESISWHFSNSVWK